MLAGLCIWWFLYGYQGADADAEQLALTEWLATSTWSPPKSLVLQEGFRLGSGLIWKLLGLWLVVLLTSVLGMLVEVTGGTSWWVALLLLLFFLASFRLTGGSLLILLFRTLFDYRGWSCRVTQPVQRTPLWPASWLPAVDKSRGSKSVEVQRVWEVYDERLQFMLRRDVIQLDEALDADEVSRVWLVWSGAAETALADAYQFCGRPIPTRGLVLGRESALFRVVWLGGHQVRKARGNAADVF